MKKYKKNKVPNELMYTTEGGIRKKLLEEGAIGEVLYKKSLVTMIGQEELWIENYKAILEYKEDCIIVSIHVGNIRIVGRNLIVSHYVKEHMMVKGFIISVSYV